MALVGETDRKQLIPNPILTPYLPFLPNCDRPLDIDYLMLVDQKLAFLSIPFPLLVNPEGA